MSEKCCDDWGQCFEPADFPEEFAPVVQTARLENWAPWGDGLRGEVYGHPNFPDGKVCLYQQRVGAGRSGGDLPDAEHVIYTREEGVTNSLVRAEEVGGYLRHLATEKEFTAFLLDTGRIFMRRKEDVQTRRSTDITPTKLFTKDLMRQGFTPAERLVTEFDQWLVANGRRIERRKPEGQV